MIPHPLPARWREMAAKAAGLADELNLPQLSDRMERLAMRPFDPQRDVVDRNEYQEFERLYGPVKSIGRSPDGSPLVVLQKGGIDQMFKKDSDQGWVFLGFAFKHTPKTPRGDDRGPYLLSRALGIPKGQTWAVFDSSGGPVMEHEKVHLSQFHDPNWENTFHPQRKELDQLASRARKNDVDLEGLMGRLSPYEVVARVAEVARAVTSGAKPPSTVDDYVGWVHGKTTDTSPREMTSAILDMLEEMPRHQVERLVRYDPRDFEMWKALVPRVQRAIMSVYRIPRGYRGQISNVLKSQRSDRSRPPSRPSSRGGRA